MGSSRPLGELVCTIAPCHDCCFFDAIYQPNAPAPVEAVLWPERCVGLRGARRVDTLRRFASASLYERIATALEHHLFSTR